MDVVESYNPNSLHDQEVLLEKHAPMVKKIAHHLMGRLPNTVLIDDLIQAGMIGLLEAANNYDASKGASFATYASIRIRGNILDEVRKNDWQPRSVYRNTRLISAAVKKIENLYGRDAKDFEVAKELEMSLKEYHSMLMSINAGQLYGYDDIGVTDDVMKQGILTNPDEPYRNLQDEDFKKHLVEVIERIPEREKLVVSLYYQEELNLKEIGAVLGVSESRVCQIHSQAMLRIKSRLGDEYAQPSLRGA